eukprot:UN16810
MAGCFCTTFQCSNWIVPTAAKQKHSLTQVHGRLPDQQLTCQISGTRTLIRPLTGSGCPYLRTCSHSICGNLISSRQYN